MKTTTKCILALVALAMMLPAGALADDFQLIPSLTVRGEYNDNIFGSDDDEEWDFITTISPGLELIQRTQRLDLRAAAKVSPFFYSDNSDLNDVDQNYRGSVGYKISELTRINANAGYDVSNRPDRELETTGLVYSNDRRDRQDYSLGFDRALSEKTAMAFSLLYMQDSWDDVDSDRQDLDMYGAVLQFTHDLSQSWHSTIGRVNFGFTRYEYDTSDVNYYFTTVGFQHHFSEIVNLIVDLGARYTKSDYSRQQLVFTPPSSLEMRMVETSDEDFGGVGKAILEMRGELTRGSLQISHDVAPGGSSGSTVQRSEAVLNLRRRLTERSALSIAAGYYKNKADRDEFSYDETDEDTLFFRTGLRWEFYQKCILEAGYSFSDRDDRVDDETSTRNLVYLQVSIGVPLFE